MMAPRPPRNRLGKGKLKEIEDTHDLFGKDKFRWMLYRIGRSFWEIGSDIANRN